MKFVFSIRVGIIFAAAFTSLCTHPTALSAQAHPQTPSESRSTNVELFNYRTQPGDTCSGIARRMFGNRQRYDVIHRYNELGPLPHRLHPGTILRLPRNALSESQDPEAEVASVRRRVQARAPVDSTWQKAKRGLDLFRGWRVNTLADSSAQLDFRDRSQLHLRQHTLVIIYGGTSASIRRPTREARLDRGTLRTRLGELRLALSTPSANAKLRGGSAVMSVDDEGASRVSNHSGGAADLRASSSTNGRSRSTRASLVRPGFGSKVEQGGRPTPPQPLPDAPQWISKERAFPGLAGRGATASGSWSAVPKAARYRVELARGQNGEDLVAAVEVEKSVTQYEIHGLPEGDYFVSLSTIDLDGFESRPNRDQPIHIVNLQLIGPDAEEPLLFSPLDPSAHDVPVERVSPGTTILPPKGVHCHADRPEHRRRKTVLRRAGRNQIVCESDAHGRFAAVSLDVIAAPPTLDDQSAPSQTEETAPTIEPPPPSLALHESFGLVASPHLVGLRHERRRGSGAWLSLALLGRPRTSTTREIRQSAGAEAGFIDDRLRIGLGSSFSAVRTDDAGSGGGSGDLSASAGWLIHRSTAAGVYAEIGAWFPIGPSGTTLDAYRLAPSVEASGQPLSWLSLRTRQAALLDAEANGTYLWSSAYGVDIRLAPWLSLGTEVDLSLGELDGSIAAVGIGGGMAAAWNTISLNAGFRYSATNDLEDLLGRFSLVGALRVAFDASDFERSNPAPQSSPR